MNKKSREQKKMLYQTALAHILTDTDIFDVLEDMGYTDEHISRSRLVFDNAL